MAIIKCKICGGDIELSSDKTFGTCEYCGNTMTLPKIDDDQRAAQFNRGNHFRRSGEFDKALAVYERIVAEDDSDAEAHWCCALCRFGIEYVEDPNTYEFIPTCHRASFDSFLEDVDYLAALEHSDGVTKRQYMKDAAKIAEVQRGILATSQNEEPFDVFICYKETAEDGQRTKDSTLAQDIYYQLTEAGYRVFFSRITLEDKVGTEYEPYIFAALNSAKIMVAVGTKPEYFNAVWVKNEWSRFLAMMRRDRSKLLLPCYRDMDPYDLPEQLSVLQSYDMSKIGFMQDLLRGIKKVLAKDEPKPETVIINNAPADANTAPLLKRAFMFLEDSDWKSADEYCEKVLDIDPECAEAYLGLLLAELRVENKESLKNRFKPFDDRKNYQKVLRFGDAALVDEIRAANESIIARIKAEKEQILAEEKDEEDRRAAEYEKKKRELEPLRARIRPAAKLIASSYHTVGLKSDGTVLATKLLYSPHCKDYGQCNVRKWRDIVAVAVGYNHTAALKADGTVVAVGDNQFDQCSVEDWRGITAIGAGGLSTLGIKSDGTVITTEHGAYIGDDVCGVIDVTARFSYLVMLKADGTVEAYYCDDSVGDWCDIVDTAAGSTHVFGLKADGTVAAAKYNYAVSSDDFGQSNVSDWEDIIAIAAGYSFTVGLKADGTVVAVGDNSCGQCDVCDWKDIVAITAGNYCTIGIKSDGTVIATKYRGDPEYYAGEGDVSGWKLFNSIDTIEEERIAARSGEKAALQIELSNLKGIFANKRRKEIEARLAEIDAQLKKLN